MKDGYIYIYGRNPVMEAAENKSEAIVRVFVTPKAKLKDKHLMSMLDAANLEIGKLNPKDLPGDLDRDVVHQGVVAIVDEKKLLVPYKEFMESLEVSNNTALLVFGEVQDPQNVGAAIRSAAAFGISGVLIPPHNQAQISGAVAKVSAGMVFRIPMVAVNNVNATITDLKKREFWTYGLDGSAEVTLTEETFGKPSVFVIGNEGDGLRQMTAETCDTLLSIPTHERCESMNASASVAVTLYDWSSKNGGALGNK